MRRYVLVEEPDDLEAPTASLLYANLEDGVLRLSGAASDVGRRRPSGLVEPRSLAHRRLISEVKWSLAIGGAARLVRVTGAAVLSGIVADGAG